MSFIYAPLTRFKCVLTLELLSRRIHGAGILTDMSPGMWPFFTFHVGKYTIHGSYGLWQFQIQSKSFLTIFHDQHIWVNGTNQWGPIHHVTTYKPQIFVTTIHHQPNHQKRQVQIPQVEYLGSTFGTKPPPLELIRTKIYVSRPNQLLRFSQAPAWPMDLGPDATKMGSNLIYLEDHPS